MADPRRSVFTIALGKPIYLTMAIALARSFLRWNAGSGIGFTLVTDRPETARPRDLSTIGWHRIDPREVGRGFGPKLHLDRLAPTDRALFIDADCLCVAPLAPAFDAFAGRAVSVVGRRVTEGEWFGDVAAVARKLGLGGLPRFNGGVYYIERGERADAVFDTARALLPRYDALGFRRLRGAENDEVLIAAAMERHGEAPIPEDGTIMNSLMAGPGGVTLDVLAGGAVLRNPRGHPRHNPWYALEEMSPALVHFAGCDLRGHPYRTEILALSAAARGLPVPVARAVATLGAQVPAVAVDRLRNLARPTYRRVFGVRAIRGSAR